LELDEEVREKILRDLSPKEIAEELDELSTDDAADIIAQKYEDAKEIISKVQMRGVRVLHGIDGTKLHTSPEYAHHGAMRHCLLQPSSFIS
jgi:hypothetical protein